MSGIWVGIDTGGTFTDLVLIDRASGAYHYHKLPTTTADPSRAILDGIAEVIEQAGAMRRNVEFLVLGTTLATNAVLEGKWARTGLITTEGFRDVLQLARQRRPHYFNLDIPKPMPPAARDCSLEVTGRIAFDGAEVTPLDEAGLRNAVAVLKEKGVEAVAVCFLHSYANPAHERKARAMIGELWPQIYVCSSSEVLAEFREFERFATTTVNASLMPVMDRYLERFEDGVRSMGIKSVPRVMQSNGGAVSPGAVRRLPINTFFSGPAGGVIGGVGLGRRLKIANLITFDMGGTSTDVCLIRDGEPAKKSERMMGGFPVRTRTLDIHTIGAGGMGARAYRDGLDGVRVHASGSSNLPVEELEHAYPFRVERYALREESNGAGKYRGGKGVVRDYRVLADDIVVSLSSERQHVAAPGACAGGDGATGQFVLNPDTSHEQVLPSAAADVALPRGSVLRIATPGGGGYGTVE